MFYVGVTHQSAPLSLRERLQADRERQPAMFSDLAAIAVGRMILATCERFEVYVTTGRFDARAWVALLAGWFDLPADELRRHVRTLAGAEAADHLLRVAAGLESRIVGERQILGQVRNAFQFATEQDSLDALLSTLTRTAIRTGKRVRQETPLGDGARSIVTVAMDWLAEQCGGLQGKRVCVVGSGRLAALAAAEAMQGAPCRLVIVGRNEPRALALAARHHAECMPMDHLAEAVSKADVVMTCTASTSPLIDGALVGSSRASPLLLIDLSVPRNVDPAVAELPGVTLGHLDELVQHGLARGPGQGLPGEDAILHAERIVEDELHRFLGWQRERRAAAAIAELCRESAGGDKQALHRRIMRLKAGAAA